MVFRAKLFQRHEKQRAADTGSHGRLGDRKVRGLHQDPDEAHDRAVGHEDNHRAQKIFRQIHRDGADDQEDQKYGTENHQKTFRKM